MFILKLGSLDSQACKSAARLQCKYSQIHTESVMFSVILMDDVRNDNKLESNLISKRQSGIFIQNLTAQHNKMS